MSGRLDYEERKQRRIENYEERAEKASIEAKDRASQGSKIVQAINGQPLLLGHHSEKHHRADLKKMDNHFRKANELEEKSKYYQDKAMSARNNNSISSDDPKAIEKLEQQLQALEKVREDTKKKEHTSYELNYLSADIRRIRSRLEELKELEELEFRDIKIINGIIMHNKDKNRIQIIFDSIPNEETRNQLKHRGFKWARSEGAWQRLFNKNAIYEVKRLIKDGVLEVLIDD